MKRRGRFLIVLAATALLLAIVVLPRISQAGRFKWFSAENKAAEQVDVPLVQNQKFDISVVASYHNDTSIPLRDMKLPPPVISSEREAKPRRKLPNNFRRIRR